MKLRCTHNSIRIRLRKSELEQLDQGLALEETIGFPNGHSLVFQVFVSHGISELEAAFNEHLMSLKLPEARAKTWIRTEQVGMEALLPLANGEHLELLIEKDFPCKDRSDEDRSDLFAELAEKNPDHC